MSPLFVAFLSCSLSTILAVLSVFFVAFRHFSLSFISSKLLLSVFLFYGFLDRSTAYTVVIFLPFASVEMAAAVVRPRVHGERRVQGVLQVLLPVFERGDAPHDRERRRLTASADGEPNYCSTTFLMRVCSVGQVSKYTGGSDYRSSGEDSVRLKYRSDHPTFVRCELDPGRVPDTWVSSVRPPTYTSRTGTSYRMFTHTVFTYPHACRFYLRRTMDRSFRIHQIPQQLSAIPLALNPHSISYTCCQSDTNQLV